MAKIKITDKKLKEAIAIQEHLIEIDRKIAWLDKQIDDWNESEWDDEDVPDIDELKLQRNAENRKLRNLIGDERVLFDKYINAKQELEDSLKVIAELKAEKETRTEKVMLARQNAVKKMGENIRENVKMVDKTKSNPQGIEFKVEPLMRVELNSKDAEMVLNEVIKIRAMLERMSINKTGKGWFSIEEIREYYGFGIDVINKIPLARLRRIPNKEKAKREEFFDKGYLYSRDDIDAYLDWLASK